MFRIKNVRIDIHSGNAQINASERTNEPNKLDWAIQLNVWMFGYSLNWSAIFSISPETFQMNSISGNAPKALRKAVIFSRGIFAVSTIEPNEKRITPCKALFTIDSSF